MARFRGQRRVALLLVLLALLSLACAAPKKPKPAEIEIGIEEPEPEELPPEEDADQDGIPDDEDPEPEPEHIVDDYWQDEGAVRLTLLLDEVTEYYDEKGGTWYKIAMHVQNRGELPICSVFLEMDPSKVSDVWTLERVGKTKQYELLWAYNISAVSVDPKHDSRYFGIVTRGADVPDVHLAEVTACDLDELAAIEAGWAADDDDSEGGDEDEESEDDGNVPSLERRRLKAEEAELELEVDEFADEFLAVDVDEVQALKAKGGKARTVLMNAHVTNTADNALCGISLWIYSFPTVTRYWDLVPATDDAGKTTEVVTLPTVNSKLEPGQTHFFGLEMPIKRDYPNIVALTASLCEEPAASGQEA